MLNLKILNKKTIKEILKTIKKQWSADFGTDCAFLQDNEGRIYLINKEFASLELEKLKINSLGLYFGQLKNNELRLSIEGSQLVGKNAETNVLELTDSQAKEWMHGNDLELKTGLKGFVIIKHKSDFLGTGKVKENKILNYTPKERRIKS